MNSLPASLRSPTAPTDPRIVLLDHGLAAGGTYRWRNETVRIERINPDQTVEMRSLRTNAPIRLRNADGSMADPTVEWMRQAHANGELFSLGPVPQDAATRQARYLLLDQTADDARDTRTRWRYRLAWRAAACEMVKTDAAAGTWLAANYGMEKSDFEYPMPSAASLRRWVRTLGKEKHGPQSLASNAGRPKNRSQLPPVLDHAVSEAALYFYTNPHVKQIDAVSYLHALVDRINAELPIGTPHLAKPSNETLRKRIRKVETFDTWAAKYGRPAALAKYWGNGEPLLVDHFLEMGYMDATELEQVIVFDEGWTIPALKCRIVAIMDVLSHAIIGWHVYPGPNRAETTAQAFMHCMEHSKYSEKQVALHPELLLLHGRFAQILPDNEKALIGPETVAGYNECGTVVMPAPVGMPTAKAALERFFRTLKEMLATLPGTMIDPRRSMELGHDAVKAAELTLAELRYHVARAIGDHNVSRSTGPFGRAPIEIVQDRIATRATPTFENPDIARRALCRTFRVYVTRNGVEKDTIRYRDAKAIDALMINNQGRLGQRANSRGFWTRGRRNDGNMDALEVFDQHAGGWVSLPSTQPAYTDRLSYWEHCEYKKAAKRLRMAFNSERQRLAVMTRTREDRERLMPGAKYRARAKMAALGLSRQVTALSGGPIVMSEGQTVAPQSLIERRDDPSRRVAANAPETDAEANGPADTRTSGVGGFPPAAPAPWRDADDSDDEELWNDDSDDEGDEE